MSDAEELKNRKRLLMNAVFAHPNPQNSELFLFYLKRINGELRESKERDRL